MDVSSRNMSSVMYWIQYFDRWKQEDGKQRKSGFQRAC